MQTRYLIFLVSYAWLDACYCFGLPMRILAVWDLADALIGADSQGKNRSVRTRPRGDLMEPQLMTYLLGAGVLAIAMIAMFRAMFFTVEQHT